MPAESRMPMIELKDDERTPCEIWSRVMGYFRPISFWNPGKQQEYRDRTPFNEQGPANA